jgi:uncharacterized coiled-coil protein SlyX
MDKPKKLEVSPFPVEKEFRIIKVKQKLKELTREELEEFLAEALDTMSRLAHQVTQLRDHIEELEGKTE